MDDYNLHAQRTLIVYEAISIKSPPPLSGMLGEPPDVPTTALGRYPRGLLAPLNSAGTSPGRGGEDLILMPL